MNYPIYSITPFTTTDFPDKIAAIAWFTGCNMRCAYCYNVPVVLGYGMQKCSDKQNLQVKISEQNSKKTNQISHKIGISKAEFIEFLDKRKGKLDGIVFSGGECTLSHSFLPLAHEVKQRNFALKVDTNGTNLPALKVAVDEKLIDYIALDFKAPATKFQSITGSNLYEKFIQTLDFLLANNVKFEVRTTLHADLLNEADISQMAQILHERGYKNDYFLQNFLDTGENFGSLKTPQNSFDVSKINSKIPIKLRNFR